MTASPQMFMEIPRNPTLAFERMCPNCQCTAVVSSATDLANSTPRSLPVLGATGAGTAAWDLDVYRPTTPTLSSPSRSSAKRPQLALDNDYGIPLVSLSGPPIAGG